MLFIACLLPLLKKEKRETTMISLKKLIDMARKWKKMAGIGRRTISIPIIRHRVADKGHFVVYTIDKNRFVVPLVYLRSRIFEELFRMSEEEFGLPKDGPITLPCDAAFLEYAVLVVQRSVSVELEKAILLVSIARKLQKIS
ncbi:hypothetical protein I3843_07G138800 [Carya illinoinensis]|nr:hypothetical protein I3843_07G138800 [Carya illinoinensis]